MTEKEAENKWCPMSYNQPASKVMTCSGGFCMWWVWDLEKDYETLSGNILKASGHCGGVKL